VTDRVRTSTYTTVDDDARDSGTAVGDDVEIDGRAAAIAPPESLVHPEARIARKAVAMVAARAPPAKLVTIPSLVVDLVHANRAAPTAMRMSTVARAMVARTQPRTLRPWLDP
jgi:hypothetical protein